MAEPVTTIPLETQGVPAAPAKRPMHPRLRELLFGLKRFFSNPLSVIGLTIIILFGLMALLAPVIAPPQNPEKPFMMPHTGWTIQPSPPSADHPLGTLQQQYDIFYGVVWGTRSAFQIGVPVVAANLLLGVFLGILAGYFGGFFDELIMRVTDIFFAIPFLIMAMALVVVIGRGLNAIIVVLIILNWPQYARVIRSEILVIREREFVQAARACGASHLRIMFVHILPNTIYSVLILASLSVGVTVLLAAALSFLGLGADTGYADWGQMVSTARNWIVGPPGDRLAFWYVVFIPGFAIALFVLGWNLLGDAVRDVFDPKQQKGLVETLVATENLVTNFYTFEGVVKALNGVGVLVNQGETYALVGESGCGKSVTVRSMMRIVQSPGRIEGGKILIFFSDNERAKAINIVERSEAFMESLRGNDISMIFQEAGAALNPVFSVSEQVGESLLAHSAVDMLEKTVEKVAAESTRTRWPQARLWKGFQLAMFRREIADLKRYERLVQDVDGRLYGLENKEDGASIQERGRIRRWRERLRKTSFLVSFVQRVPLLSLYRTRVRKTVHQEVVKLLTSLGIANPANVALRFPHELSGGMQQRIVIAIALACNPRLLIADEPTSNLDVTIQAQIVELIRTLKETVITSVLYITHDLGLVAEICDRVTVMYAGDTCETAAVREIFAKPLHPYTQGLLRAVPKIEQEGELATIPGSVPNLVHPPTGCRFHPRCPSVMDICRSEKPPVTEYAPGHTVSCYLYGGKDGAR